MGDEFKSGGGPMNAAKDQATINNNYFFSQKEFVQPSGQQKIFFGVPNLPPNHLPRPEYIDEFRAALQKESIGLTGAAHVGVEGMGGIGKSVLAAALAHDKAVQAAFPDGIFWLTFGQNVEDAALLVQQNNILKLLGHQEQESSLDLSRHKLNSVLHGKRCLFIIDDIWDSRHLKCFDFSGTSCRFLLTSRKADVLDRLGMERKRIDLLSEEQALVMLAQYARCALADLPKESKEIAKECGYLPLAVAAIGSMVRGKPADRWQLALRKLQEAKLDKISCKLDYQYENLFRALQVSVEALPEAQQQYYKTLAVFPEDTLIPESVVVMYWEHCAFSDDELLDVIDTLVDSSLLTRINDDFLLIHDLLLDYLVCQSESVVILHKQLLMSYKEKYPDGWNTIPYGEDGYLYNKWIFHARTGNDDTLLIEIADDLIHKQHKLSVRELTAYIKFVDYELDDIAKQLLNTSENPYVIAKCLAIAGSLARNEAKIFLKKHSHPCILIECLKICEVVFKKDVLLFLTELLSFLHPSIDSKKGNIFLSEIYDYTYVLILCLNMVGGRAKKEAKFLVKRNRNDKILATCLKILGNEAAVDAKRLLRTSNDKLVQNVCQEFILSLQDTIGGRCPELARLKKNLEDE